MLASASRSAARTGVARASRSASRVLAAAATSIVPRASHRSYSIELPPLPAPFPAPRHQLSAQTRPGDPLAESNQNVDAYYGSLVFDRRTMKKYLSASENERFLRCIANHQPIDFQTADSIANALLRWATERGATHFTHWFQPITGTCAEKHDTFIDVLRDGETPLVRFTGKQLIMGEPDGSSFPSGGLRSTHTARGYTAWDPHSPPFVLLNNNGGTLYIPSCFFSWDNSYALDEKIPLLRSEAALARETMRLFRVLGESQHTRVHMDAGLEQEFFLIDRKYYLDRPDLMLTGRTMIGASPPKGQELDDQYFAPVSSRMADCIHEFEVTCWKLGIPLQTRHREVAPGQYEIAPKFAPGNIGTDRNLLLMDVLKRTARKHDLTALLHEKPFKGVNGSGKHNNWSLGTNEVPSLLDPGSVPEKNPRFMLFLAATLRAVDLHGDLLRVAISGVGNDHRLGAHEAPPAIVSAYLGDDIEKCVERFIGGQENTSTFDSTINLGITSQPDLRRVQTDRNRTSTFAFTGNKFEFRAVGASHNPARSTTMLNTIVAQSVRWFADEIEAAKSRGVSVDAALKEVTQRALREHKRIIFNGNGYSKEWEEEAGRRGLPNLRSTPDALDTLYSDKNISLFESMRVLTRAELAARSTILFEDYTKRILIEGRVLVNMVQTHIAPAAFKYQQAVADSIAALERVAGGSAAVTKQREVLTRLSSALSRVLESVDAVRGVLDAAADGGSAPSAAHYCEKNLLPAMEATRVACDQIETILPADQWPFPTYHQMLFHQD